MAQAVNPSFPTARLNGTNPLGPSKHDQRSEHDAHDVRREHGGYDDRSEQDLRRELDERGEQDLRHDHAGRGEREERDEQGQGRDHDGRRTSFGESGNDRRERSTDRSRPATSTSSGDAFGPVLAAWGQAYASMFELAADMMKLQQRTFASMIAAADTYAERTAEGEQRGRVLQGASASRPDSDSDHLEHDRR
jgi:hypothetical protein